MSGDLLELEAMAGAIVRALSAGERRSMLRKMAQRLALSQRQRVAAQRAPDGSAFEPRKQKTPAIPSRGSACFLYPSSGGVRRVIMRGFSWDSDRKMTGFDVEAGGIRSFHFDKVVKWLPVPEEYRGGGGSTLRSKGGLRRRAMFRRLSSGRYLRSGVDDRGFWVGFSGKASEIAGIHQHGLRDKPSLRARAIPYPKRELIGATDADREMLLATLYQQLGPT
ncbi:phage gpG-like protein [Sphingobium sp. B2D3B]|uniref:phage virion morphogenesis protein n=1 Tax=Sphingobium sp. B2D3B TaxID=2940580 RepID=UPI00222509E8|nr:phage virion morphogenesis protein [Sphingobium sp. B2D3B]MCW2383370.1 phage gpG-like protein [Sphingobium sp. B2D3B]